MACRSLGFAAGAELLVGESSPFPGPPGSTRLGAIISCDGAETSLSDCDITIPDDGPTFDYFEGVRPFAAALICTNPSGVLHTSHVFRAIIHIEHCNETYQGCCSTLSPGSCLVSAMGLHQSIKSTSTYDQPFPRILH